MWYVSTYLTKPHDCTDLYPYSNVRNPRGLESQEWGTYDGPVIWTVGDILSVSLGRRWVGVVQSKYGKRDEETTNPLFAFMTVEFNTGLVKVWMGRWD